ncbi:cysteine desulfurase [Methanobrevibacter sp. 87.7]|uniref:aminotransferase class V-fold PLP-dependent enzyme n=1 Tax=Methanobrevibacter sp. 87.7 TaxID=387957 RepID=UPI000B4FFFD0|nr:cysteine desulfurase [Methanobrevibacter sp. 87.7]OWT33816.1 cysteine desulfurase [Methanobrevibacter sp. 87.7]
MIDLDYIREDFPILNNIIYFDSASTSLTPIQVVDAMEEYFLEYNSNAGRGTYKTAIKTTTKIDQTREKLASFINCKKDEVIFTKNTTEGINLISNGFDFKKGDNIIISDIEHHSNFIPWLNLQKKGINIKIAKADKDGLVNKNTIYNLLDENTRLVAISHISNAIGSIQDIEGIEKIVHKNQCKDGTNTYLLVDGAQSIGHINIDISKLNPDFMAFPGHKGLLGPVGTGFIYIKETNQDYIYPQNLGGGTITNTDFKDFKLEDGPQRFEGGTQNLGGIIGLGRAIDYINNIGINNIEEYDKKLTHNLYESLNSIDNIKTYGNENNNSIVSFNIDNANPHDISKILDESKNICLRSGHHCAIPAIKHIGAKEGTIRASIHLYNNTDDIEKLVSALKEIIFLYS